MIIRKMFDMENAHIVRGCSTLKCRSSLHGHSYKIELLFESNYLDNGQMVIDFGLIKHHIKDIIDAFDHSITLWSGDDSGYIEAMKRYSDRWVVLPVSPSAEQFARVFFVIIDRFFALVNMKNGEKEVKLHSVIAHETDTGYAQAFREDAYSKLMGEIALEDIHFSKAITDSWRDSSLFESIKEGRAFINPTTV